MPRPPRAPALRAHGQLCSVNRETGAALVGSAGASPCTHQATVDMAMAGAAGVRLQSIMAQILALSGGKFGLPLPLPGTHSLPVAPSRRLPAKSMTDCPLRLRRPPRRSRLRSGLGCTILSKALMWFGCTKLSVATTSGMLGWILQGPLGGRVEAGGRLAHIGAADGLPPALLAGSRCRAGDRDRERAPGRTSGASVPPCRAGSEPKTTDGYRWVGSRSSPAPRGAGLIVWGSWAGLVACTGSFGRPVVARGDWYVERKAMTRGTGEGKEKERR